MPRIIVTTDPHSLPDEAPVLLDEHVRSVHLSTGHASSHLIERLGWAISDAELAEGREPQARAETAEAGPGRPERPARPSQRSRRRRGSVPARTHLIGA